jgi:hypothetical protein
VASIRELTSSHLLTQLFLFILTVTTKEARGSVVLLRHCATSRNVAGSNPNYVTEYFQFTQSSKPHYGPGFDSGSTRYESCCNICVYVRCWWTQKKTLPSLFHTQYYIKHTFPSGAILFVKKQPNNHPHFTYHLPFVVSGQPNRKPIENHCLLSRILVIDSFGIVEVFSKILLVTYYYTWYFLAT